MFQRFPLLPAASLMLLVASLTGCFGDSHDAVSSYAASTVQPRAASDTPDEEVPDPVDPADKSLYRLCLEAALANGGAVFNPGGGVFTQCMAMAQDVPFENKAVGGTRYELGFKVAEPATAHLLRWYQTAGPQAEMVCADTVTPWVRLPVSDQAYLARFAVMVRDSFDNLFVWKEALTVSPPDTGEPLDTLVDVAGVTVAGDQDGDGVPDSQDAFPADPVLWLDSNNDGVSDQQASWALDWQPGVVFAPEDTGDWWDFADPLTRFQHYDAGVSTLPALPGDQVMSVEGQRQDPPIVLTQDTRAFQQPFATEAGISFAGYTGYHLDRIVWMRTELDTGVSFALSFRADEYSAGERIGGLNPFYLEVDSSGNLALVIGTDVYPLGAPRPGQWQTVVFSYDYQSDNLILWLDGKRVGWEKVDVPPRPLRVVVVGASDKGSHGFEGEARRLMVKDYPLACSSVRAVHQWLLK